MIKMDEMEKQLRKIAFEIAEKMADEVIEKAKMNMSSMNADASGLMRASFGKESGIEYVEVGNEAPYAGFVDRGTRPHPVPVQALRSWVAVKLKAEGKEGERTAYAVASKIAKEGTKMKPFWTKACYDFLAELGANEALG